MDRAHHATPEHCGTQQCDHNRGRRGQPHVHSELSFIDLALMREPADDSRELF
jgi:hypothetical protein